MFFSAKTGASPSTLAALGRQGYVLGAGTTVKSGMLGFKYEKFWSIRLWQDCRNVSYRDVVN